jgi:histone acetyltransferase (RNA polymerase elongator complex component)
MRFKHPEPAGSCLPIYPVFIPFAGCRERCVFCSQEAQTGRPALAVRDLPTFLQKALAPLLERNHQGPFELAYYGGTFTALPQGVRDEFMRRAAQLKAVGRIAQVRCSTRPDAVTPALLRTLKAQGLDTVELGIQSFCDVPLARSRRNYGGAMAVKACRLVKEAGLRLGIQLMPGMPGMSEEDFRRDAAIATAIKPAFLRLYPCLVLDNTVLAGLWRSGDFTPWTMEAVLKTLPEALLLFWARGIRVIRLGLAPQAGLNENILAGPAHPALGQRLRSLAMYRLVLDKIKQAGPDRTAHRASRLRAPRRFQGEFYGHGGELKAAWAELGLGPNNVEWLDQEHFELE